MSLRFVGRQLLQTQPITLLNRAPKASLSFSIRIQAESIANRPGGVVLFGGEAGILSVHLSGLGSLKVAWRSQGVTSSHRFELEADQNYHVASVWDGQAQRYYLNGLLVHEDHLVGPLGHFGSTSVSNVPFRLGSDLDGVDVTFGELALWYGYALTPEEAQDLGQGVVRARDVFPEAIALRWSLAGVNDEVAQAGDLGLSDNHDGQFNLITVQGSAPVYQSPLSSASGPSIGSLQVAPSGESILVSFVDGAGSLSPVQSLFSSNDAQFLSFVGAPKGSTFNLQYNGKTTSPIPIVEGPPGNSAVFQGPITPGAYDIAVSWVPPGGFPASYFPNNPPNTSQSLWVVYDGLTRVGSVPVDQSKAPTGLTDSQSTWFPLGTFNFTGTTLKVVLSGTASTSAILNVDGLRYVRSGDTNAANVQYIDDAYGGFSIYGYNNGGTCTYNGPWRSYPFSGPYQSTGSATYPSGTTPTNSMVPAQVQNALQALAGVPPGSISAAPSGIGNALVTFVGQLAGLAQPTLTTSDPAVSVTHDGTNGSTIGGVFPTISINGGSPIKLRNVIWGASGGYQHWLAYVLPQSAPAVQYFQANTYNFNAPGYGVWDMLPGGSILNNLVPGSIGSASVSTNPSGYALWPFQGLPPGTYSLATTWSAASKLAPSALFTVTDASANVLGSSTVDQTKTPADFQEDGVGWKTLGSFTVTGVSGSLNVTLTYGSPGGSLIADTLRLARTSADQTVKIGASDSVTFSAIAGFATTRSGPASAQSNASVSNLVGGSTLPAFVPSSKTMKVGYNIAGDCYFSALPVYANLAHRVGVFGPTSDSNFYTTSITNTSASVLVSVTVSDSDGLGRGLNCVPKGRYTIQWDGSCDVALINDYTTTATEDVTQRQITGTTNNQKVFDLQDAFYYAPQLQLQFNAATAVPNGPSPLDFQNLRIFPPGVPTTNPPRFHPSLLSSLKGMGCLRFLDPLGTNGSNIVDYVDFPLPSWLSYANTVSSQYVAVPIVSITGYTGSDLYFNPSNIAVFQVTTSQPHGLKDGWPVVLGGPIGTANYNTGSSFDLTNYSGGITRVLSPTVFLTAVYSAVPSLMTNTLTPSGCYSYKGPGAGNYSGNMAFLDCIELCNTVGADLWINVPHLATDACVTSMAQAIATGLSSNLKVHVEFSNECWNFGFLQFNHCYGMSRVLNGPNSDYSYYYTLRSSQVHAMFYQAFQAANRSTSDVRRVMATQGGWAAGPTASICAQASAKGIQFDELATAPYFHNDYSGITEPSLEPIYALLTPDQLLDIHEMTMEYGGMATAHVTAHLAILASYQFNNVKIVQYEGGPEVLIPNGSPTSANANARNHAVHRHTRFYGIMSRFLQMLQDAGSTLFNQFKQSGGQALNSNQPIPYQNLPVMWGTYTGCGQLPGTGDPTKDTANNTTPEVIPLIKSEVGGAMHDWAALTGPQPVPISDNPNRNGRLKTSGLARSRLRQSH